MIFATFPPRFLWARIWTQVFRTSLKDATKLSDSKSCNHENQILKIRTVAPPELRKHYWEDRENKKALHPAGFEPTTCLLQGLHSATLLQPQPIKSYHRATRPTTKHLVSEFLGGVLLEPMFTKVLRPKNRLTPKSASRRRRRLLKINYDGKVHYLKFWSLSEVRGSRCQETRSDKVRKILEFLLLWCDRGSRICRTCRWREIYLCPNPSVDCIINIIILTIRSIKVNSN